MNKYNYSTSVPHPTWVKIYAELMGNHKNARIKSLADNIFVVDKEQGFNTKAAIDKTSEYFVKYLRNRYNYTCVVIQQQASDVEGLEAIKAKKMMPSASGLGDSKFTGRDKQKNK